IVQLTPGSTRVNPTLEIRGNVDFSTGSVDFPGDVVVFGDVRDCFTVKSGRDLTVHHLVDGATLHAARDCTLRHGMASKDRHKVVVGRNLDARYLSGVDCHVGGIARIESDITHCLLEVRGDVLGPECCVVHGELRVDRSCDVAELGSQAGIETVVRIASEDRSAAYVERAQQLLSTLQSRIVKAEERVRDLRSVHGRMTSSQADALTELSFEVERLGSMKGRLQAGLGRLKALSIGAAAGVTVRRVIHPGVTIALGRWTITFTELARGPIRLRISPHGEPEFAHPDTGDLQPTPSGARITAPAPVALAQAA
ncbi:MAG: FapA family protein, partial [Phycisphaerales bacterium]